MVMIVWVRGHWGDAQGSMLILIGIVILRIQVDNHGFRNNTTVRRHAGILMRVRGIALLVPQTVLRGVVLTRATETEK